MVQPGRQLRPISSMRPSYTQTVPEDSACAPIADRACVIALGLAARRCPAAPRPRRSRRRRPSASSQLTFEPDGLVTLVAQNVTVREILAEWARQGRHARSTAPTRLTGGADHACSSTISPKSNVLESLLRGAVGLRRSMPRADGATGASIFEVGLHPGDQQSDDRRLQSAPTHVDRRSAQLEHAGDRPTTRFRRSDAGAAAASRRRRSRRRRRQTEPAPASPSASSGAGRPVVGARRRGTTPTGDAAATAGTDAAAGPRRRQVTYNSRHEPALIRLTDGGIRRTRRLPPRALARLGVLPDLSRQAGRWCARICRALPRGHARARRRLRRRRARRRVPRRASPSRASIRTTARRASRRGSLDGAALRRPASFDRALCLDVLEHLTFDEQARGAGRAASRGRARAANCS